MRRSSPINLTIAVLIIAGFAAGCSLFSGVAPGSDPVIVDAERVMNASFATMDTLVSIDDANRETVKAQFPAAHAFVEQVRAHYPDHWRAGWSAISAYKATKTTAAADDLQTKLKAISALAEQARTYLVSFDQKGLKPPAVIHRAAARPSA